MTDIELLDAWSSGDDAAGNELVRRHFASIFRFFRSKAVGSATDLAQATFLACLESHQRFRREGSFRAFLLGIARRQLFNHYRRLRPRTPVSEIGATSAHVLGGSPSEVLVRQEQQRLTLAAMRRLPLDLQICLELFYWEDLKQGEIGEVLGIPEGTVKSRLHRARRELRAWVERLADEPDLGAQTADDFERWARSLRDAFGDDEG